MTEAIEFGSKTIRFHLEYSNRKSLGITVTPEMDVLVKAPIDTSVEIVKEKIRKKASWIIKQQSFFLSFQPKTPLRKYVSGETHLYLGKQYRLQIQIGNEESVKLKGKFIEVTASEKSRAKDLLNNWYLQHARTKFQSIAQPLIDKFKKYEVVPSSIVLREMQTRWGSCTPKGKIILNPELIKAPKACIEYVIIHELCHLVHHDHTQKFIDLQTKEMKDWEKWKMKLETLLA
ncbi:MULTISPECIES: SprT family zinc-dependent metalloprotease [unclassified Arcicella]|uniref:M48 family metallopeptidase n=1 Tax=unclassified Arcicella TaxID=2644986 RepID=UPI002856D243|nr:MULTISPECIES: SprT family zinc-dependent metalloprotease [unclassified Arcicella]MDR6563796.1 putative metal-dependent hydrolase [Arcicella sp. BE51]MDR6813520.1 putative metal-dependent hydrolase [Arcicella sp. BE140]MDR6824833.1 putative metal-dependent hydrolase [Arcicella sp. BE139]